jgi:hypothetical protein
MIRVIIATLLVRVLSTGYISTGFPSRLLGKLMRAFSGITSCRRHLCTADSSKRGTSFWILGSNEIPSRAWSLIISLPACSLSSPSVRVPEALHGYPPICHHGPVPVRQYHTSVRDVDPTAAKGSQVFYFKA